MGFRTNRRNVLRAGAMATAGLAFGPRLAFAEEERPAMSIARYSSEPTEPEAIAEEARKLTEAAIQALGGMERFVSKGQTVWVKPNIGWDRTPEQAANTNPDVVATLVRLCYDAGAKKVIVGDKTCNDARRSYSRSGIEASAQAAGAEIHYIDDRKFEEIAIGGTVLDTWPVYKPFVEADVKINVPICKHHGLSQATVVMKNLMGCIGGNRGRLHQDIGPCLADLQRYFKPELNVVDAIRVLMRGGPTGGNLEDVERRDLIAASADPVALDAFSVGLIGKTLEEVPSIAEGEKAGLGVSDYRSLKLVEVVV